MPADEASAPATAAAVAAVEIVDSKQAAPAAGGAPFMATNGEKRMLELRFRNKKKDLPEALASINATMDTLTKAQFVNLRNSLASETC
jgi:hypothetical protein